MSRVHRLEVGSAAYKTAAGDSRVGFDQLATIDIAALQPIRNSGVWENQRNMPGWWWSETDHRLVPYESINERTALTVLDWEPSVTAIAAQPFRLRLAVRQSHVPDFLVAHVDGSRSVVDVTTRRSLEKQPRLGDLFTRTARVCSSVGWDYVVVRDVDFDPQFVYNLRFLASFRRRSQFTAATCSRMVDACEEPMAFGDLTDGVAPRQATWSTALHLIWHSRLCIDLWSPITATSLVGRSFHEVLPPTEQALEELIPTRLRWAAGHYLFRGETPT